MSATAAAPIRLGEYREDIPQSFRTPDEDFYVLELVSNEDPVQSKYVDKATGEYPWRVNLKFKIVADLQGDIEFAGEEVGKFVGIDLNPNDKGSIWHVLQALDPTTDPEPGKAITPYFGMKLIGQVEHNVKASTKRPGETVTYANVGAVKPMKKAKKAAAAEGVEAEPTSAKKKNPLLDDEE